MEHKNTPGPWFADEHGGIWRREPKDLYENGGPVAGDRPLAIVHIGWSGDGVQGYPLEANARLIAAAPELLEALIKLSNAYAFIKPPGYPKSDAEHLANAAIAKATGSQT